MIYLLIGFLLVMSVLYALITRAKSDSNIEYIRCWTIFVSAVFIALIIGYEIYNFGVPNKEQMQEVERVQANCKEFVHTYNYQGVEMAYCPAGQEK
jgi:predicted permease